MQSVFIKFFSEESLSFPFSSSLFFPASSKSSHQHFLFVHHALTFINAYDLIITLHMSNTQIQNACRQR